MISEALINEQSIEYSELPVSLLTKNLMVLSNKKPDLAERLRLDQPHKKIELCRDAHGFVNGSYLIDRNYDRFFTRNPNRELHTLFGDYLSVSGGIVFMGMGLGYGIKYLLQNGNFEHLILYERDISLLKVAMTINDFAADMITERLTIICQEELPDLAGRSEHALLLHPLLFSKNKVEYLTISRLLKGRPVSRRKVVLLSGQLFVLDTATTLYEMGWDVYEVDAAVMNYHELHAVLDQLKPDLVLHVNLFKDIEQFSKQRVVVQWEIDPTISPIEPIRTPDGNNCYVFTHNPQRLSGFEQNGFRNSQYMPLCANISKFRPVAANPELLNRFGCDISFVGSIMQANQHRLMKICLDKITELSGRTPAWLVVRDYLNGIVQEAPVPGRDLSQVADLHTLLSQLGLSDILQIGPDRLLISACLDEYLGYMWRRHVVSACLPLNIRIWGDPDWRVDFAQNYCGVADHYLDLPKLYSLSKINLDICRIYQSNIITMRIFDVMACGGFVLADRNKAITELFAEEHDIVCYESAAEAVDKASFYLKNDSERQRIAANGYQQVIDNHTFKHRVTQIMQTCGLTASQHPFVMSETA